MSHHTHPSQFRPQPSPASSSFHPPPSFQPPPNPQFQSHQASYPQPAAPPVSQPVSAPSPTSSVAAPLTNAAAMTPSSAASLRLHYYQTLARREGEREFDRGVGQRQRTDDVMLARAMPTDAATRKRRKTRSAYVSRYAAKSYARLLEEHVRNADAELATLRVSVDEDARRLRTAREMLDHIEHQLQMIGQIPQQAQMAHTGGDVAPTVTLKRPLDEAQTAETAGEGEESYVSELAANRTAKCGTKKQTQHMQRNFFGGRHSAANRTSAVWQDVLDFAIAGGRKEVAGSDVSASECESNLFSRAAEGVVHYE